jgi:hypothetical protein
MCWIAVRGVLNPKPTRIDSSCRYRLQPVRARSASRRDLYELTLHFNLRLWRTKLDSDSAEFAGYFLFELYSIRTNRSAARVVVATKINDAFRVGSGPTVRRYGGLQWSFAAESHQAGTSQKRSVDAGI